jgi:hypothetical protein
MKARLSTFLKVVATAIECGIIAVGIAFAITPSSTALEAGLARA